MRRYFLCLQRANILAGSGASLVSGGAIFRNEGGEGDERQEGRRQKVLADVRLGHPVFPWNAGCLKA